MPALTITAVDNTTEQISITAHGLNTGDGPAAVYVPAGGVIPGGLAPVTSYWVIRVDANTIKLATSSANALANSPINITSNGTLPLQLVIGLPYCVPRTAAPNTQAFSADFNADWAAMVALWNLLSGQAQSIYSAVTLAVQLVLNGGATVPSGQNITLAGTADLKHPSRELGVSPVGGVYSAGVSYDQTNKWAINSAAAQASLPILGLKVGDRINSVDFNHFGNASAYSSVFTLNKMTSAGVASIVATSGPVSTPASATWGTFTVTVGSPVAVAAGEVWWLEWLPNATVQRIQGANVKFDRP